MVTRRTLLAGGSVLAFLAAAGATGCATPLATGGALIGMAAFPWKDRIRETGPVQVRRSFCFLGR